MPQNITDDKSTLIQVMAWGHQATSHYLSQCRPISMSPYGTTQLVKVKWKNYLALLWPSGLVIPCGGIDNGTGNSLTHWGRVTHKCVGKLTTIGLDNGLSPGRRQAIIWTNAGILLIGPLGTKFSEILIEIHTFSFKKMHLKMSSGKWRPFCPGLNVLMHDSLPLAR